MLDRDIGLDIRQAFAVAHHSAVLKVYFVVNSSLSLGCGKKNDLEFPFCFKKGVLQVM